MPSPLWKNRPTTLFYPHRKLSRPWLVKLQEELWKEGPSGDGPAEHDARSSFVPFAESPVSETPYKTHSPSAADFLSNEIDDPFPTVIDTMTEDSSLFSEDLISRTSMPYEGPSSLLNSLIFRPSMPQVQSSAIETPVIEESVLISFPSWIEESSASWKMSHRQAVSATIPEHFVIVTAVSATHIYSEVPYSESSTLLPEALSSYATNGNLMITQTADFSHVSSSSEDVTLHLLPIHSDTNGEIGDSHFHASSSTALNFQTLPGYSNINNHINSHKTVSLPSGFTNIQTLQIYSDKSNQITSSYSADQDDLPLLHQTFLSSSDMPSSLLQTLFYSEKRSSTTDKSVVPNYSNDFDRTSSLNVPPSLKVSKTAELHLNEMSTIHNFTDQILYESIQSFYTKLPTKSFLSSNIHTVVTIAEDKNNSERFIMPTLTVHGTSSITDQLSTNLDGRDFSPLPQISSSFAEFSDAIPVISLWPLDHVTSVENIISREDTRTYLNDISHSRESIDSKTSFEPHQPLYTSGRSFLLDNEISHDKYSELINMSSEYTTAHITSSIPKHEQTDNPSRLSTHFDVSEENSSVAILSQMNEIFSKKSKLPTDTLSSGFIHNVKSSNNLYFTTFSNSILYTTTSSTIYKGESFAGLLSSIENYASEQEITPTTISAPDIISTDDEIINEKTSTEFIDPSTHHVTVRSLSDSSADIDESVFSLSYDLEGNKNTDVPKLTSAHTLLSSITEASNHVTILPSQGEALAGLYSSTINSSTENIAMMSSVLGIKWDDDFTSKQNDESYTISPSVSDIISEIITLLSTVNGISSVKIPESYQHYTTSYLNTKIKRDDMETSAISFSDESMSSDSLFSATIKSQITVDPHKHLTNSYLTINSKVKNEDSFLSDDKEAHTFSISEDFTADSSTILDNHLLLSSMKTESQITNTIFLDASQTQPLSSFYHYLTTFSKISTYVASGSHSTIPRKDSIIEKSDRLLVSSDSMIEPTKTFPDFRDVSEMEPAITSYTEITTDKTVLLSNGISTDGYEKTSKKVIDEIMIESSMAYPSSVYEMESERSSFDYLIRTGDYEVSSTPYIETTHESVVFSLKDFSSANYFTNLHSDENESILKRFGTYIHSTVSPEIASRYFDPETISNFDVNYQSMRTESITSPFSNLYIPPSSNDASAYMDKSFHSNDISAVLSLSFNKKSITEISSTVIFTPYVEGQIISSEYFTIQKEMLSEIQTSEVKSPLSFTSFTSVGKTPQFDLLSTSIPNLLSAVNGWVDPSDQEPSFKGTETTFASQHDSQLHMSIAIHTYNQPMTDIGKKSILDSDVKTTIHSNLRAEDKSQIYPELTPSQEWTVKEELSWIRELHTEIDSKFSVSSISVLPQEIQSTINLISPQYTLSEPMSMHETVSFSDKLFSDSNLISSSDFLTAIASEDGSLFSKHSPKQLSESFAIPLETALISGLRSESGSKFTEEIAYASLELISEQTAKFHFPEMTPSQTISYKESVNIHPEYSEMGLSTSERTLGSVPFFASGSEYTLYQPKVELTPSPGTPPLSTFVQVDCDTTVCPPSKEIVDRLTIRTKESELFASVSPTSQSDIIDAKSLVLNKSDDSKTKEPKSVESDYSVKKPDPKSIDSDNLYKKTDEYSTRKPDPKSIDSENPFKKTDSQKLEPKSIDSHYTSKKLDSKSIDSSSLHPSIYLTTSIILSTSFVPLQPLLTPLYSTYSSSKYFSISPSYVSKSPSISVTATTTGTFAWPKESSTTSLGIEMASVLAISSFLGANASRNATLENGGISESDWSKSEVKPTPSMDLTLFKDNNFWILTVLEAPVKGQLPENFSQTLEQRLANAYSEAFRNKFSQEGVPDQPVVVKILSLTNDLLLRQLDIVYVVERGGALVPADTASELLNFLRHDQLREFLGLFAILKAKPYRPEESAQSRPVSSTIPVVTIVCSIIGFLLLLFCCLCVYCRCCRPKQADDTTPISSASGSLQRSLAKHGQHNRKHLFQEMTQHLTTEMVHQRKQESSPGYVAEKEPPPPGKKLPPLPASDHAEAVEKAIKMLKILESKDASTSPASRRQLEDKSAEVDDSTLECKKTLPKMKKRKKTKEPPETSKPQGIQNGTLITDSKKPPKENAMDIEETRGSPDSGTSSRHTTSSSEKTSEEDGSKTELMPPLQDLIAKSKAESQAAVADTQVHLSRVRQRISDLLDDAFALANGRKFYGSMRSKKIDPATEMFPRYASLRSQSAAECSTTRHEEVSPIEKRRPISEGAQHILGTLTDDGQLITRPPPKLVWERSETEDTSGHTQLTEAHNRHVNFFPFQQQQSSRLLQQQHQQSTSHALDTLHESQVGVTPPDAPAETDVHLKAHYSKIHPAGADQYDELDVVSALREGEPVADIIQAIKDELKKFSGMNEPNESNA